MPAVDGCGSACGADALKLQYYSAAELVADTNREWTWGPKGKQKTEVVGQMFDRLSLSIEDLAVCFEHGRGLGLPTFCTPFSVQGVADLEALDNPIYKVASSDLAFYPMLQAIADTGKPTIVSTGKAPMRDVHDALKSWGLYPFLVWRYFTALPPTRRPTPK